MSAPNGAGGNSPFAARTRAPFPAQGQGPGGPTTQPGKPGAAVPASGLAPAAKQTPLPLVFGVAGGLAMAGVAAWFLTAHKSSAPAAPVAAAAGTQPAAKPAAPAAARDAKSDYTALVAHSAALTLEAPERAALADATLRAASGAYAEAQASLGPIVAKHAEAACDKSAAALRGIKLDEYPTPAAQRLRQALAQAEQAAKDGAWAEAVARRDEAAGLVPAAQAEIAKRLSEMAREAAGRGDNELATYFYERALRLDPADAVARAHLFAHKFKAGQILRAPGGIELAYAPPGEFMRGSRSAEPGRSADEEQAKVRLTAGFFLGVTEVTQGQWDLVFGPGAAAKVLTAARAAPDTQGPDLPMHSVRWDEANEFCARLSAMDGSHYRLPTEAEWEYACRAGTTTAFNLGGDGLSARDANIDDGSAAARSALAPAGTIGRANAWGLRDMHGNVWEWCADWSAPYPAGEAVDPRGPADGAAGRADLAMKVVRGGGWNAPASDARSANRWEYSPAVATTYIGLRVAQDPELAAP